MRKLLTASLALMFVAVAAAGCRATPPPQVDAKVFLVKTSSQEIELVAVPRRVSAEMPLAEAVLQELLKGPTTAERRQGITTLIPEGAVLRSVSVSDSGVVRADFSEGLQQGVGGSMRVLGIRQQIEATLMWISGITSIILSVDGQTEDILQP
ncbi:MAG: GerMN domain-containing protein [Candidatus Cryosericum sp.]